MRAKNPEKFKTCFEEFSGLCALQKHRSSQRGIPKRTSNLDMDTIPQDVDDGKVKTELNSCNQFLVDSELEKGRHFVFKFAMSSFNSSFLNENFDHLFNQLKCAAKVNLAIGFVLQNIEDGTCRYFYAHENFTVKKTSKLVCTQDDMVNLKENMQKLDFVDHCTRERANSKWRFCKLTTFTVFAWLLKDIPKVCKETVLPETLFEKPHYGLSYFRENYETTLH